jgi:hypothetical protein
MTFSDPTVFTPYSGVKPLMNDGKNLWAPETDRDRIGAYQKFEEIYWSHDTAFQLQDDSLERPVFIPNPRVICDSTSHFWMKGFEVVSRGATQGALDAFLDREEFIPKFHVAKHSGVVRGDFVLHLTADPTKPEGSRVSVNSVDPGMYFPEFDDHNLDRILAVNLVEQILDPVTEKPLIHRLRYRYVMVGAQRKVTSQEAWYEVKDWFKETRVQIKQLRAEVLLPDPIDTIPVYLFKNQPWQGDPFGSSEIRGYEALQQRINQSATDEDMALALEGLGVYTTDAPPPTDEEGTELAWNIVPGRVVQTPAGAKFERVKGVSSVEPFQSHIDMMVEGMYESSATFRAQLIDDKTAESGIALAIRFLPTLAKLEERDFFGVARLTQFFFDWKNWHAAFEGQVLPGDIEIVLGDKLPNNKTDKLNVYNNLLDRKAISKKWYREQVGELYGVEIPADMEKQIEDENRAAMELMQEFQPADTKSPDSSAQSGGGGNQTNGNGNQSNNRNRTNESGGTEAKSGSSKRG